jgi:hypothetical protein
MIGDLIKDLRSRYPASVFYENSPRILPSGRGIIPGYKEKAGTPYTLFFTRGWRFL